MTVLEALAYWTVAFTGLRLTIVPMLRMVAGGELEQPVRHNRRAGDR